MNEDICWVFCELLSPLSAGPWMLYCVSWYRIEKDMCEFLSGIVTGVVSVAFFGGSYSIVGGLLVCLEAFRSECLLTYGSFSCDTLGVKSLYLYWKWKEIWLSVP